MESNFFNWYNISPYPRAIRNIGDYYDTRISETESGWCRGTICRGRKREDRSSLVRRSSRRVTPAGYLSGVSLHPTFTDTMLLRSPLRHPLSSSVSSRARHQEDVLEDPRNGLSFGRLRPLHLVICIARDRFILLAERSLAVREVARAGSIIVAVSTQRESMNVREDRGIRCCCVGLNDLGLLQRPFS